MTRKHYNLIADVIKQANRDGVLSNVAAILLADRFAKALVGTNDNFDKSRFYNAATELIPKDALFETEDGVKITPRQRSDISIRLEGL